MTADQNDRDLFDVGLAVNITSRTGASGHLYMNETMKGLRLTPDRMAALIVKARLLMGELIEEFQ